MWSPPVFFLLLACLLVMYLVKTDSWTLPMPLTDLSLQTDDNTDASFQYTTSAGHTNTDAPFQHTTSDGHTNTDASFQHTTSDGHTNTDAFQHTTSDGNTNTEGTSAIQSELDHVDTGHVSVSQRPTQLTDLIVSGTPADSVTGPAVMHSTDHHINEDNLSFSEVPDRDTWSSTSSRPNTTTFHTYVQLGMNHLHRCLSSGGKIRYHALHMEILVHYEHRQSIVPERGKSSLHCELDMIVPVGMAIKIQANFTSRCDNTRRLHIVEIPRLSTLVDECSSTTIMGEFSLSNRISSKISVNRPHSEFVKRQFHPFVLHLNLTAVPSAHQLEVHFLDHRKGFVQTPRWDGHVNYPHSMNSEVAIDVPAQHRIMLSFYSFQIGFVPDCSEDSLKLITEVSKGRIIIAKTVVVLCGTSLPPDSQLYDVEILIFLFVSNTKNQYPGFKAVFSFHTNFSTPQQSAQGLWNCTVPQWSQFKQHFPCNLESNCINSEDEADCDYTTDRCGIGVITVDNGCYIMKRIGHEERPYRVFNDLCKARGGYLASLNTKREWENVRHVLQQTQWDRIMVGLQHAPQDWPSMYRKSFYWADGSVAYFVAVSNIVQSNACVYFFRYWQSSSLGFSKCVDHKSNKHFLCELDLRQAISSPETIRLTNLTDRPVKARRVRCPSGHVTHSFLSCDVHSQCWADPTSPSASCQAPLASLPPVFVCADGTENVPYTLVCDHRRDCFDNSDELFCFFPPCRNTEDVRCTNGQCVPLRKICDGQNHCLDNSHQHICIPKYTEWIVIQPPPGKVEMKQLGKLEVTNISPEKSLNGSVICPETHFQCAMENYYCLPVYLRCNDVYDCPNHEDELSCHNYMCVGFYRCRSSQVCVHPDHLCDDLYQCPQRDDELLCDLHCPDNCTCHGLAFTCITPFQANDTIELRHLDAKGTFMTFCDLQNHTMLIYLNMAQCNLTKLPYVKFPNLHHLILNGNLIHILNSSRLTRLPKILTLSLSGNPLTMILSRSSPQFSSNLQSLDLSSTHLFHLDTFNLTIFTKLRVLNLSGSGLDHVSEKGFQLLPQLKVLDVRGCTVSMFPRGLMENLEKLQLVLADNYKLCCPATLPAGFPLANCHAPSNEVSSCDTLLRSDFFRMFLYVFALMSLIGNSGSFVYRTFINKAQCNQGFSVFVSHLCVSDFLMGLYLTIIGIVDRMYQGSYLWEDVRWRNSVVCKLAGFLSLLSCEASTFIICLITVDRFLVLRFPFSHYHFRKTSAQTACLSAWLTGLAIAILPLLPVTSHWEFYKQSSICIPLPVTRQYFKGRAYSFGVMVVLNSILFLLIAMGQAFIYHAIRMNSMSIADTSKSSTKELTIARRLITIVMSDFFCWFPIGFLGLLASQNIPIAGEVNVGLAIFVLPLNSALNPFLYTMNVIKEKRRHAQFKRLQTVFQSQIHGKTTDNSCHCKTLGYENV